MTISITVKTKRWPALVNLTETEEAAGDAPHEHNVSDTTIPADSSQTFHIGHTSHITIRELEPMAEPEFIGTNEVIGDQEAE